VIDLERRDFLGIAGIGEEDADRLLQLIDELTVVEGDSPAEDESRREGGERGEGGVGKSRGTAVASGPRDGEQEQRRE
jgi:hypothetical protein